MDFCGAAFLFSMFMSVVFLTVGFLGARYPTGYIAALRCPNASCDMPLEAYLSGSYNVISRPRDAGGQNLMCPHCGHVFPPAFLDNETKKHAKLAVGRFNKWLRWEWRE